MPIVLRQKMEGVQLTDGKSSRLLYVGYGSDDDAAIVAAAEATAPTTRNGLVRGRVNVDEIGFGMWLVEVPYDLSGSAQVARPPLAEGESSYQFEIGGETWHITQSLNTQRFVRAGDDSAKYDFKGAIGVSRDADGNYSVEGVDVGQAPGGFRWSETHCFADADVDEAYTLALIDLRSRPVNADAFRGIPAGCVLWEGCTGTERGDELWDITFRFGAIPLESDIVVGDITVCPSPATKKGMEYLWVLYDHEPSSGAERLVKVPVCAYVERVLGLGDFSVLGI